MIASVQGLNAQQKPQLVNIPDFYLEYAIRNYLDKPTGPITIETMESLTRLVAVNKKITDLSGLEYAINLQSLYLSNNQLVDNSPISKLTNLK